nr:MULTISPECIES: Crp/Fnr family transcriptional regulator [unclassified Novosphingobium]
MVAPDATQREWIERQRAGERAIARGEEVLRQGAPGDRMFTVLDGVLMRYRLLEDGRRQVVNVMFPGDLVGLQAAFDGEISHGVTALTDVRLCVFPRDRFMDLVTAHPRFAYDVIWLCAREEDALEQHLVALGQRPARERVAYLALWLVERGLQTGLVPEVDGAAMLPVTITQGQVADMLGLSLVHTNRTMQALRKAGQVDWSGAGIRVPDLASVRALVGFDPHGLPKRPYI